MPDQPTALLSVAVQLFHRREVRFGDKAPGAKVGGSGIRKSERGFARFCLKLMTDEMRFMRLVLRLFQFRSPLHRFHH